jgi:thiol-disulfide isomerase/thioredoxin
VTCAVTFSARLPSRDRYTLRLDRGAQLSFGRGSAVRLRATEATGGAPVAAPPSAPVTGNVAGLPGPVPAGAKLAPEDPSAPRAPALSFSLLDGKRVDGASLWSTRPVVAAFTASWCARCPGQQAMLNTLARKYEGLVAFVGVAQDDKPAALKRYAVSHEVPYAVGIDDSGTSWRNYGVSEPPVIAVIGKGGRLLRAWNVDITQATLDGVLSGLASRG